MTAPTLPRATPRQLLALQRSKAKINIWYGSTRSSKTVGSILDFLNACALHDGIGLLLVIGVTRDTAWNNVFNVIFTEPIFASVKQFVKYRQGSPTARVFGQQVMVVGASDERSWTKIQGMKVAYALGDEATAWPESFFKMLVTRLEMDDSKLLVTCNPGGNKHYLKTDYIDKRHGNPDIHVERMLLEDNPTVSQSFKDMLDRVFTGPFHDRMIKALWVAAEGAVFAKFDEKTMVVDTLPSDLVLLAGGLDYGTNHPSAAYKISVQPATGQLFLHSEWSPNPGDLRLTDNQLADSFAPWLGGGHGKPRYLYADPAAASFRQELHVRGIKTTRADNAVVAGINRTNALLVSGVLKIHRDCEQLLEELPEYRWDSKAVERGNDAPVKENDDHVDAMRYTVYSSRGLWRRYLNKNVRQALEAAA